MPDLIAAFLFEGFRRMGRSGLRGIWQRGDLPDGPFVWAANHHSWWDPFIAAILLPAAGRRAALMMSADNLADFPFARRLGAFGTDEPRTGLRQLAGGRTLVIYPEAELRPPCTLGPLSDGATWYATRARVPLVAAATRVLLRGHQAPEAYVSFATVDPAATAPLADALAEGLRRIDTFAATCDPRRPLPGFRPVFDGRRSWDERLSRSRG